MLWFRAPEKVYFKKGCLPVALDELGTVMGKKKKHLSLLTSSFIRTVIPNVSQIS